MKLGKVKEDLHLKNGIKHSEFVGSKSEPGKIIYFVVKSPKKIAEMKT